MAKSITATQMRKIREDIVTRIKDELDYQVTYLEGHDGYLSTLQSGILETVNYHLNDVVDKALRSWEVGFERDDNARVKKLEDEVKRLRKENKELAAIKKLVDDAKNSID